MTHLKSFAAYVQKGLDAIEATSTGVRTISIYLANLNLYNEGYGVGRWVDLPCDEDALSKIVKWCMTTPYTDDSDYAIHDMESPIGAGDLVRRFSDPWTLNTVAEALGEIDEDDLPFFLGYLTAAGIKIDSADELTDALEDFNDNRRYGPASKQDIIDQIIDEDLLAGLPEGQKRRITHYIDTAHLWDEQRHDYYMIAVQTPVGPTQYVLVSS